MEALALANTIRIQGVVVRQELRCGVITLAQALADERAGHLPVNRLLCSQRQWGPVKANLVLRPLMIWPTRKVRDLTDRQQALIVEAAS
jgi:hypothetical protein